MSLKSRALEAYEQQEQKKSVTLKELREAKGLAMINSFKQMFGVEEEDVTVLWKEEILAYVVCDGCQFIPVYLDSTKDIIEGWKLVYPCPNCKKEIYSVSCATIKDIGRQLTKFSADNSHSCSTKAKRYHYSKYRYW